MASPADGLTRLQKVAVFLITLGEQKAREVLVDVDLRTVEQINAAILELGPLRPEVKAAVMIEFSDYFFKNKPLSEKLAEPPAAGSVPVPKKAASEQKARKKPKKPTGPAPQPGADQTTATGAVPPSAASEDEAIDIAATLRKLRERIDPGKIDWGRAGYDFGEGFKGPDQGRR